MPASGARRGRPPGSRTRSPAPGAYQPWPLRADDALHAFAALGAALCGDLTVQTDRAGLGRVELHLAGDIAGAARAAAARMADLATQGDVAPLRHHPWDLLRGLGQQPDLAGRAVALWDAVDAAAIEAALSGGDRPAMKVSLRLELAHESDVAAAHRATGAEPVPRRSSPGLNALAALALREWRRLAPLAGETTSGSDIYLWRVTPIIPMRGAEWLQLLADWPSWNRLGSNGAMTSGAVDIWRHRVALNARMQYLADPDRIIAAPGVDPTMALALAAAVQALAPGHPAALARLVGSTPELLGRWRRGADTPPRDDPLWRTIEGLLRDRAGMIDAALGAIERTRL